MRGSNSTWRRASRRVCCSMPLSSCCAHVRHTHATPCVNCLLRAAWLGTLGVRHASYASRYQGRSCGKEAGGWGWGGEEGREGRDSVKKGGRIAFQLQGLHLFLDLGCLLKLFLLPHHRTSNPRQHTVTGHDDARHNASKTRDTRHARVAKNRPEGRSYRVSRRCRMRGQHTSLSSKRQRSRSSGSGWAEWLAGVGAASTAMSLSRRALCRAMASCCSRASRSTAAATCSSVSLCPRPAHPHIHTKLAEHRRPLCSLNSQDKTRQSVRPSAAVCQCTVGCRSSRTAAEAALHAVHLRVQVCACICIDACAAERGCTPQEPVELGLRRRGRRLSDEATVKLGCPCEVLLASNAPSLRESLPPATHSLSPRHARAQEGTKYTCSSTAWSIMARRAAGPVAFALRFSFLSLRRMALEWWHNCAAKCSVRRCCTSTSRLLMRAAAS